MTSQKLEERTKRNKAGCMLWLGYRDHRGYGQAKHQGKTWNVHRLAYHLFVGEIPPAKDIDHLCRNRSCINPKHLEAVSHRENQRRGNGWAGKNARKTKCPVGHPYSKANTYINPLGARVCRKCMRSRYLVVRPLI